MKPKTGTTMQHLQRVSRTYIVLLNGLIVGVPIGNLFYWLFLNSLPAGLSAGLPVQPTNELSSVGLGLALLVSLIPLSVALYILVALRSLFMLYAKGIIFSVDNVKLFRRLGYALFAWVGASGIFTPLISAVVSFPRPTGERAIVAELGILDLSTLLIGGVVLILAWVMSEGCELQHEQAYTV